MDLHFFKNHFHRLEQFFLVVQDCLPAEDDGLCRRLLDTLADPALTLEERLPEISKEIVSICFSISNGLLLKQSDGMLIDHRAMLSDLNELCGLHARLAIAEDSQPVQLARCQWVQVLEFLIESVGRGDAIPKRLLLLATRAERDADSENSHEGVDPPDVLWN